MYNGFILPGASSAAKLYERLLLSAVVLGSLAFKLSLKFCSIICVFPICKTLELGNLGFSKFLCDKRSLLDESPASLILTLSKKVEIFLVKLTSNVELLTTLS